MQQTPQMIPMMTSFPPTNITTEQIQKGIDENKKLILAIMDNQNIVKLAECAQLSDVLGSEVPSPASEEFNVFSRNCRCSTLEASHASTGTNNLSSIALYKPTQMAPHLAMQPGYYMQHPQAAAITQQQGIFPSKTPLQFGNPHQMLDPQSLQGQMGMRPGGIISSMYLMHELALGGGGIKQDASEPRSSGGNGLGSSAARVDGESSCLKGS